MKTSTERRAIVVLDAGIATEENRKLIKGIGFDYVCVSPTKIKDYRIQPGKPVCQITTTTNKQTNKQTNRQTNIQTDKQTNKQTNKQKENF